LTNYVNLLPLYSAARLPAVLHNRRVVRQILVRAALPVLRSFSEEESLGEAG